MLTIPDIIGISGVIIAIVNHFCMLKEKIKTRDILYNVLNILAGIYILVSLMYSWNLPSFLIEICWFSVNGYGLFMSFKHKKKK